jgi:hypothetical protein
MRFEERELKAYAEPVPPSRLVQGAAYFSVTYVDDQMLMPRVEPLIFAGENLDPGDVGRVVYFQDVVSYRQGIRRDSPAEHGEATFFATPEGEGAARRQWMALGRSLRSEAQPLPFCSGDWWLIPWCRACRFAP